MGHPYNLRHSTEVVSDLTPSKLWLLRFYQNKYWVYAYLTYISYCVINTSRRSYDHLIHLIGSLCPPPKKDGN